LLSFSIISTSTIPWLSAARFGNRTSLSDPKSHSRCPPEG
jgi:hypothetical protein